MSLQKQNGTIPAIIGGVAVILAAVITGFFQLASTKTTLENIFPPATPSIPNPTITTSPMPTLIYTASPQQSPIDTISPTLQVIETPTEAPVVYPTDTSSDTAPGTILALNETWREDGLELSLSGGTFTSTGVLLQVYFANKRSQSFSLRWSKENFSAVDNNETQLEIGAMRGAYRVSSLTELPPYVMPLREVTALVEPGQGASYAFSYGSLPSYETPRPIIYRDLLVKFDLFDPSITEIIFKISNISSITNAQWRIPGPSH